MGEVLQVFAAGSGSRDFWAFSASDVPQEEIQR